MRRIIPLSPGNSHLSFTVDLSSELVQVRLDWLTRDEYYTVQISRGGTTLIAGIGLHPGMNLLERVIEVDGDLFIEGRAPTPDNLGEGNRLVYET